MNALARPRRGEQKGLCEYRYERKSNKEFINFLSYAKGSCGELRTQIYIGIEINYIEKETGMLWIKEAEEISRMIAGLMAVRKGM